MIVWSFLLLLVSFAASRLNAAESPISLAGEWRFALDRQDAGITEAWFARKLPARIHLPGSLPAQGIGDPITTNTAWTGGIVDRTFFVAPEFAKYRQTGQVKVPFWLQPDTYYAGVAWYQRDFTVPAGWKGKRIVLFLERAHWETTAWVDGRPLGSQRSLSTPHEYVLGPLGPGKHTLSLRVDNRRIIDIGENSHSISDHTQGNWNGVVGRIELQVTPPTWIDDLQIYPHVVSYSITVSVEMRTDSEQAGPVDATLQVKPWSRAGDFKATALRHVQIMPVGPIVTATLEANRFEISLGTNAPLWDEFNPALYELTVTTSAGETRTVIFGLREAGTDGTQFTINGRKTFIRGTLECCIFPKTGHPPTEIRDWKRILQIAKDHGLNLMRFHSYCPPEAAFAAADELGFYFQIETSWANQSTTLGDGKPVDQWTYEETGRILRRYGNHPCFLLMPYGNEPGGKHAGQFLAQYVAYNKLADPRRLWTSGSGWPQLPENQFHITPDPRIQAWGDGLKSRINAWPPETTTDYSDYIQRRKVPVISHEIGQWCVYPNFDEIPKYTGYLKPKNFEIFRDFLNDAGMGGLARQFLLASGKLQTLCYKEDIESALRTPGMGGFELLDLHDFPGQGTALVGVLDPFWDDKGYVTAAEYRRFCNSTVPLARLAKRVFTTDETFMADLEVAHFGSAPLTQAVTIWKLVDDDGHAVAGGELAPKDIPIGNGVSLGGIQADLQSAKAPARYKLVVSLKGTPFANDWDVWVYPAKPSVAADNDIYLTDTLDATAQDRLQSGGKVLLTIPGSQVQNYAHDPVKLGFSSIFWNTAWTGRQAPTTLGILCNPRHPALAEFPTDFCSNWQWWYLIHGAGALRLDLLPPKINPVVRIIDDWFTARPLGLIIEGKVGPGKIVVCGFDLTQPEPGNPVARQMRQSLLDYMSGKTFDPGTEVSVDQILSLSKSAH